MSKMFDFVTEKLMTMVGSCLQLLANVTNVIK